MEIPASVIVFCPAMELKNRPGRLVAISPQGYYEVHLEFPGNRTHTTLLPIVGTAIVFQEANVAAGPTLDIER